MREMFVLNLNWFMQTLLARKDNMSMASSLEVRVPFCDYRLVEYAYNMPWNIKALDGREKGILRKAFENDLPKEIAWRKKSPYPKTHNPAYFARVKELLAVALTDKSTPLMDWIDIDNLYLLCKIPTHSLSLGTVNLWVFLKLRLIFIKFMRGLSITMLNLKYNCDIFTV